MNVWYPVSSSVNLALRTDTVWVGIGKLSATLRANLASFFGVYPLAQRYFSRSSI